MNNVKDNKTMDYLVRTHIRTHEYNFKWILDDYSRMKNGRYLRSPYFCPEIGSSWSMSIYKSSTKICLHMHRSGGYGEVEVQCKVTVAGCNGKIWKNYTSSFIFNNTKQSATITSDILLKEDEVENKYNDAVEVILQLKICKMGMNHLDSTAQNSFSSEEAFQRDVEKSLTEDLVRFYESPLNTDFVLSIGKETLCVHKAILGARSPVFAKMFQQDLKESTDNKIVITDVTMATMKEVVAFMYGKAKSEYCFDTALEVYYAADKYDIRQLKEICSSILFSNLSMENVYQVLQLADRHDDKLLMKKVIKFIFFYSDSEKDLKRNLVVQTA